MELKDFYNAVSNPLNKKDFIKRNIDAYYDSKDDFFYNHITDNVHETSEFTLDEEFKNRMFNNWKNNITNMKREDIEVLVDKKKLNVGFLRLYDFIREMPSNCTREDIINGLDEKRDTLLVKAFDKYYWNNYNKNKNFVTISSTRMSNFNNNEQNIKHRLYLNLPLEEREDFAFSFIKRCEKENIPYLFKFAKNDRDDGFVIYTSHDNLLNTINVLDDIKKNTSLLDKVGNPPIYTGLYNGYIGYGSEPNKKDSKYISKSYNSVRANLMERAIKSTVCRYELQRPDELVIYGDSDVKLKNVLSLLLLNNIARDDVKKNGANSIFNSSDDKVVRNSYEIVKNNIDEILKNPSYYFDKVNSAVRIRYNDYTPLVIDTNTINNFFKDAAKTLSDNVNNFDYNVSDEFSSLCDNNGISHNNIAFEEKTIEAMDRIDKINKGESNEPIIISYEDENQEEKRDAFDRDNPESLVNKYGKFLYKDSNNEFINDVDNTKEEEISKLVSNWIITNYNNSLKNVDGSIVPIRDYVNKIAFTFINKQDMFNSLKDSKLEEASDIAYSIEDSFNLYLPSIINEYQNGLIGDGMCYSLESNDRMVTIDDGMMTKVFKHIALETGIIKEYNPYINSTLSVNQEMNNMFKDNNTNTNTKSNTK